MSDLKSLRIARKAAWDELEMALTRLHSLTVQMLHSGVAPPGWDEQNEAARVAQVAFEDANTAYLEALGQKSRISM